MGNRGSARVRGSSESNHWKECRCLRRQATALLVCSFLHSASTGLPEMSLGLLPGDVLGLIFRLVTADDLWALARTSKNLRTVVSLPRFRSRWTTPLRLLWVCFHFYMPGAHFPSPV
jgi:hypothetical protein